MLIQELGAATTLLIGFALGFANFIISGFWLSLFFKNFDIEKFILPLFWVNEIIWIGVVCILPYEWLNDNVEVWGWPFMIYFFGSLLVIGTVKLFRNK